MLNLSKDYIRFLQKMVDYVDMDVPTSDNLFAELAKYPFEYIIPKDENRASDGLSLRWAFYDRCDRDISVLRSEEPCSFLEFLIALSERMSFICSSFEENVQKDIFWKLLSNLGINHLTDDRWRADPTKAAVMVKAAVEKVNNRSFGRDGEGGLFPLKDPSQNQREVEIWYQMNQYLRDPNGRILKRY